MNNTWARVALNLIKTAAFALYVFLFYELLAVPAILDWSLYGIALTAALSVLLALAIPRQVRLKWLVLAITFLLALKSLNNLLDSSLAWQIGGGAIIFVVLLLVGKIAGGFPFRHFTTVFLMAVLLIYTVDLTEIPFWSEFTVKWKSPLLYPKQTAVDYFPLQALDVDNDGIKEIVTQGNPEAAQKYIEEGHPPLEPLEPEENRILIFKWKNNGFRELAPDSYDPETVMANLRPDYINFPYYKAEWIPQEEVGLLQKLSPEFSKTGLVEMSHNFGLVPFTALEGSLANIRQRKSNLDQIRESLGLDNGPGVQATGKITTNNRAAVILGKNLQVVGLEGPEAGSVLGEITPDNIADISTSELFTADVNDDGIDEILLNTEYAKLLQLKDNGRWEVIWSSRDNSFRFEDFDTLGAAKKPEIIALSKSQVRNNPTRYITGYELSPEGLVTKWRVFTGLINLNAADINGDGQNELIGYGYKSHRIFVLEKHGVPVSQLLYALTGLLIAYGAWYRFFKEKKSKEAAK